MKYEIWEVKFRCSFLPKEFCNLNLTVEVSEKRHENNCVDLKKIQTSKNICNKHYKTVKTDFYNLTG